MTVDAITADAMTANAMTADAITADLLHQAQQGDAQAIAILLNRQLAPRGLRIQTKRKETVLALLIDSDPVPSQTRLLPYLEQSFKKLASPQIECVRVYGRAHNQEKPAWMAQINLAAPPPQVKDEPAAGLAPPTPPQPLARLPRQPFVRQWWVLNSIAIVSIWMLTISSASLLGETSGWRQGGVALLGASVYGGAQTYGLARRLNNAPQWWVVSMIPIGLWFLVSHPLLQVLTVATLWGVQCWVLKPHGDRVYWQGWFVGNFLGIIGVGFVIALLKSSHLHPEQHWEPFWNGFIWLIFLGGMTGVQGLLLATLLRPLPDRRVLPPEAYFRTTIAHFSQRVWQTIGRILQRLKPAAKRTIQNPSQQ